MGESIPGHACECGGQFDEGHIQPELSFERELTNVKTAIKDQNIPYPVAIDNDLKNWNAFNVWAEPTWFIQDKQGAIRFTHVGEGAYAESEQIVAQLLKEKLLLSNSCPLHLLVKALQSVGRGTLTSLAKCALDEIGESGLCSLPSPHFYVCFLGRY
jgi:hypothetical protein